MANEGSAQRTRTVLPPDERRAAIVDAAHTTFVDRGISRTTVADVARSAGVTRGLVYHYFPQIDLLVDAVLDRHVAGFVAALREWDQGRRVGDVDHALLTAIALFRAQLTADDPLRLDLHRVENSALYQRFIDRSIEAVVDTLQVTTVEAYARLHRIEIVHVRQTFTVLMHGLVGLVRTRPDTSDDVLVAIVRQVLRLETSADPRAPEAPTA